MKKFHINLLFFALSFYCLGAGFMDSFVIYDGWNFVGAAEFPVMHQAMSKRIVGIFVLPMAILFVLTICQYWFRPAAIPRSWITMALVSQSVGWLSSIFIQIPIQTQLSLEKDEALLEKLIVSDWLRVVAWLLYITVLVAMLYRINSTYKPVKKTAIV